MFTQTPLLSRVGLIFFFFIAFHWSRAQITSNFSTNNESWTIFNTSTGSSTAAVYSSTGGNPGGYVADPGTTVGSTIFYAEAPAKFLGNFSLSYNQNLTFDLKQSTAGTDNTSGDVIISNSSAGISLYYQLATKPGTAAFSSYSIQLNETAGWHYGSYVGAAPTQTQMKQALSNITSLRIRLKYTTSNTFTVTGSLDNVVLNVKSLGSPPTITSFTPTSALAGATMTITGTNFNTTASQNAVYFKGVKTTASTATSNQLTVTIPASAGYGPIAVTNLGTGLQGLSAQSYNPLFDNNKDFGGQIIPASMSRGYNVILPMSNSGNTYSGMDKGDFDGDGWIDLVTSETFSTSIYVFRNLGTGGAVSASSFAAGTTLTGLSTIPGGSPGLGPVVVADVDNDGKPDIAAVTSAGSGLQGYLAVFRNTSTSGSISFASPQFFAYPYYSNQLYMTSGDMDGDGRVDFLYTTGSSPGGIWINQNLSSPGNVDFAYGVSIGTTVGHSDVKVSDLNGDGKPELIAGAGSFVEIYRNTSTAGSISVASSFTVTTTSGSYFAVADLDADNKTDLLWSAYGAQYIYLSKNNYNGSTFDATSFGSQIAISSKLSNPDGLNVSDINSDGKPDIVIIGSSDLGIMQNVGSAGSLSASSFLSPTLFQGSISNASLYGLGPAIADLDGDNKPEVAFVYSNNAVPTAEKGIYIFHNESFPVPQLNAVSPSSGVVSTQVTLTGSLLSTGSGSPSVRLSGTLTPTTSPSNSSITSSALLGAKSGKFRVTHHGLTSASKNFSLLFSSGSTINSSAFSSSIDFSLASNPRDAVEVADFDDDGKMDVAVIDNFSTCKVFQNATTPGQSITNSSLSLLGATFTGGYNFIPLDIDGDGKVDLNNGYGLLQNNSAAGSISFLSGPNGVYTYAGGFNYAVAGDFNKDGKLDLAVTNGTASIQVYENQSTVGTFINSTSFSTFSQNAVSFSKPNAAGGVVAADFDGDGYEDLISTNITAANLTYYLNAKTYGPITTSSFSFLGNYSVSGSQPYNLTANDFDGDGKTDIAVTYFNSAFISVQRNTSVLGDISFSNVDVTCNNKGYNITSQDLDGDGKPEIIVIHQPNPGPGSFTIFKNNSTSGNISFAAGVNFPLSRNPQAINIADINSDQKPDILIVGSGGSTSPANALMVFENKITSPTISITSQPTAVYSVCDGATPTISTAASGTTNIAYQWQIFNSGSGGYVDLTNTGGYSNVSTSSMTINSTGNFGAGTYRCKINGDFASTVYSNTVSFTVNPLPPTPVAPGVNRCGPGSVVITASGGSSGQYLWYDSNGLIAGQNNSTYTTPSLSTTTPYSVAITDGTCVSAKTNVTATILTSGCATINITTQPIDFTACSGSTATFTTAATGTTNITYQWQFSLTGSVGTFNDIANGGGYSNVSTATLSVSTSGNFGAGRYRCKINGDFANTVFTADEGLFLNPVPAAPTVQGASSCSSSAITLTASGGSNGQYRWYTVPTLGTAIAGQVNSTYLTPTLSTTTTFYVSIVASSCESARTAVTGTIGGCSAPVITPEPLSTQVGGKISIDLKPLISTPNSSLNLTSLQVVLPPSSGATATIDVNGILTITYSGITFSGTENITIKACDLNNNCTTQQFGIEVAGDIDVFNGISPDGANPKFIIKFIELIPETKNNDVYIFDRWENLVWHGTNYDNSSVVFTGYADSGSPLPSGVYFYKIVFSSGRATRTGFISLRR